MTLSSSEFRRIQDFRYLYSFSGSGVQAIPNLTDFVDSVLMFTANEIKRNKNVARGFFNRIIHRKNETGFIEDGKEQIEEGATNWNELANLILPGFVLKHTEKRGKITMKFIYNVNKATSMSIEEIKITSKKASNKDLPESTTQQDIIREALLFATGNNRNGFIFFGLTYMGTALGLSAVDSFLATSVAIGTGGTMNPKLVNLLSDDAHMVLGKLLDDSILIEKFIGKIDKLEVSELSIGLKETEKFISEAQSNSMDLNYFSIFQGFTLALIAIRLDIFNPVLLFVSYKSIENTITSKKLFIETLSSFLKLAKALIDVI